MPTLYILLFNLNILGLSGLHRWDYNPSMGFEHKWVSNCVFTGIFGFSLCLPKLPLLDEGALKHCSSVDRTMQLIYRSRNSFTKVLLQTHLLHELDNIIKYHATSLKCNTTPLSTSKAHNHQPPLEAHSLIICHTSISLKRWQCMICLKPAPLFGNTQHPPLVSQHVAQLREK